MFRFKDAVAAKGDNARLHYGVIAQNVETAFKNEGLDPENTLCFVKILLLMKQQEKKLQDWG